MNQADDILKFATEFEKFATEKDPKAKVRNRGTVVFPASSSKDDKDHFPINDADQARNALGRASQYDKAPDWYSGSLQSLVSKVRSAVKSKYPSIETTEKSEKSGKD